MFLIRNRQFFVRPLHLPIVIPCWPIPKFRIEAQVILSHFTASTIWLVHMPMQRHHVSLFLKGESEEEAHEK